MIGSALLVQGPVDSGEGIAKTLSRYLANPSEADVPFGQIAERFALDPVEIVAIRLAVAAEQDLLIGHVLSHLQQPLALTRPTIGLVAQAYAPDDVNRAVQTLGQGNAVCCGLLQTHCSEERPLPERQLRVPLLHDTCAAAISQLLARDYPDRIGPGQVAVWVPRQKAGSRPWRPICRVVGTATASHWLFAAATVLETRAAAAQIATWMSLQPILVQSDQLLGMAPWLVR